jgi:F-type H+-transporting ATPase subunit b
MEKLGINPLLIGVQIINFGLLLFLLKKVLYKPVLKAIAEREQKLKDIEAEKEKVQKESQATTEERAEILESARNERNKIISEAKKEAEEEKKSAAQKANAKAKAILEKADEEVQARKNAQEGEFKKRVVEAASVLTKKVLSDTLTSKDKEDITNSLIVKLRKVGVQ